jgi:hypothetical protein
MIAAGEIAEVAQQVMVHGIIIAAMLTLIGDNGSGDQVPAPPPPPSHPAQVSMKAADRARSLCGLPPAAGVARWRYGSSWSDLGSAPSMGMFPTWDVKAAVTSWKIDVVAEFLGHSPLCSS